LIPGFFGFADLGEVGYFGHVRRVLAQKAQDRGASVHLHVVHTAPTSSLVHRTSRLHDAVAGLPDDEPVHLIGHSTGGLDARLLCTPDVKLPDRPRVAQVAERVRSVVTVATPHRGTPTARIFQGVRGRRLLKGLSLATLLTLRTGKRPVSVLLKLAGAVRAVADRTVGSPDLVDEVFKSLLDGFDEGRREELQRFMAEIGQDTSLVGQLTPEALHALNAVTPDRPGVRYASVITSSPRPRKREALKAGPRVGRQAALGLYTALHGATSRSGVPVVLDGASEEALRVACGEAPPRGSNDAIVPTRSQPWGRILTAVQADHLDVLGHFAGRDHQPPHYDWLPSGARFDRPAFEQVWEHVLDAILAA